MNKLIALILFTCVLYPAFNTNFFGLTDEEWFDSFQVHSEGLVISRVILAEQEALWHSAGLNGMYVTLDFDTIHMLYQMDLYLSGETPPVETYHTYHSQNGLQGTVIAMLYNLYGGSREGYLKLTRSATSFLSALCLAGFLVWILFNIGWIEAFCTALMILLSGWIVVTGTNIFFQMWSFFLPIVVLLWYPGLKEANSSVKHEALICLICWGVTITKCLFSGFEFITTTCLIIVSVCVLYAVLYRWSIIEFLRRSVIVSLGTLAGVGTSLVLLLIQISIVKGGLSKAKYTLKHTFFKRTYGDADDFQGAVTIGLEGSLSGTLEHFFGYPLFTPVFHGERISTMQGAGINMWHILIIAALLTVSWLIFRRKYKPVVDDRLKSALVTWFWFSLIGPLSWYVIFKSHAYSHPHLDTFVWFMLTLLIFPIMAIQLVKGFITKSKTGVDVRSS